MQLPIPENEADRLKALESYEILDTLPEEQFDRLTHLIAAICGTPISLVSLIDSERQWFKSRVGAATDQTPREIAFCQYAIMGDSMMVVEDTMQDERFSQNPLVVDEPGIRFYAGQPLIDPNGYALGTLCVLDTQPRHLSEHQKEALRTLAAEVMDQILFRKKHQEMLQLQQTLQQQNELLEKNEAQFRFIAENTSDGIAIFENQRITYISPSYQKILGYTFEEVLNRTPEDVFRLVHPDDQDRIRAFIAHNFAQRAPSFHYEYRCLHKNGTYIWREDRVETFYDEAGTPVKSLLLARDISERKAQEEELRLSEQRYQSVVQSQKEMICRFLPDTTLTFVNEAYCRMFGKMPEELIGVKFLSLVPQNEHESIRQHLQALQTTCQTITYEHKVKLPDGTTAWQEWTDYAIVGSDGQATEFQSVGYDITERKQYEQNLLAAQQQAEAASRAKSEFLANMSHEIRTPLNSVIGFSDLLMRTVLNPVQQQYMKYVYQAGNTLLDLINDILDFSKIEAGKMELVPERIDLWEMAAQVAEILQYKVAEKQLTLHIYLSPELPQFVWIDPVRIKQVLLNLLSNAVKFTDNGSITLSVSLSGNMADSNMVKLLFSVKDTGIGISEAKQQLIFQAFSQGDSSTTRKYGGTGLGLTISNKLLALMNAHLQLESLPGQGSHFFFELEVKAEQIYLHQKLQNLMRELHELLIVQEEGTESEHLKNLLDLYHIPARFATDGISALGLLADRNNSFGTAIIDYEMPFMDGATVIQKIRNDLKISPSTLPTFLMHTPEQEDAARKDSTELQTALLQKPVSMPQLFNILSHSWRQRTQIATSHQATKEIATERKVSVLIIDDNPMNRLLASNMVRRILPSAHINEATDGQEGLQKYQQERAELVLMDVQMPQMSGYEATKYIRKDEVEKGLPPAVIVALTAGSVKGEQERCLEAGMNDYLCKPITFESLQNILQKWVIKK